MSHLFHYNTLKVELFRETLSAHVTLNRPEFNNAINSEMIFELETFTNWLTEHKEISTVVFKSSTDYFSPGLDSAEVSGFSTKKMQMLLKRFQKLTYSLLYLPQTIIFDLAQGASEVALEFSLAGDIRLARSTSILHFNHLLNGFTPACGGISLLENIVGKGTAKKWVLTAKKICSGELENTGLVHYIYKQDDDLLQSILKTISSQSSAARIQAKRSFLESTLKDIDKSMEDEYNFSNASLMAGDWKSSANSSQDDFMTAKEYTRVVKALTQMSK